MKAPDKIYLYGYPLYDEPCAEWAEVPFYGQFRGQQAETVEYIRRDALIEWTNKMLQDTADRLDFYGNQAFAQLFDKLNSL